VKHILAITLIGLTAAVAAEVNAQDWARKMFDKTSHNFGAVGRGSKQEYAFEFTNLYQEDVRVASVRSTCGCATVRATRESLKTFEKGEIVVVYNTRSFLGAKGSTITVVFDRPYHAEVQLTITGYVRSDVVFNPGSVDFGSVELGRGAERSIDLAYAGRSDWEIVDIRSANQHFEVELDELARGSGRINYSMLVRLKPSAPAGFIQDQLTIVTNDGGARTMTLAVEGRVESPLTVSPASLFLGVLEPGQTVTRTVVVRGNRPFRIVSIRCDDEHFTFSDLPDDSKPMHFVPVEFTAGNGDANVAQRITIETDLGDQLSAEFMATATIKR
jgi:hypothetical protein